MTQPAARFDDVPPDSTLRWVIDHLHIPLAELVGKTFRATSQLDGQRGGVVRAGALCTLLPKHGRQYQVRSVEGIDLLGPFAARLTLTPETSMALGIAFTTFPIWGSKPGGIVLYATATIETEHAFEGVRLTAGQRRGRVFAQMFKVQTLSNRKGNLPLKWFSKQTDAIEYKNSTRIET